MNRFFKLNEKISLKIEKKHDNFEISYVKSWLLRYSHFRQWVHLDA